VCEYDSTLTMSDPGCEPPVCADGELGEYPDCEPVCEYDSTLTMSDPGCEPPVCADGELGEYPACEPVCEYNPTVPASDPGCEPPVDMCPTVDGMQQDRSACTEVLSVVTPRTPAPMSRPAVAAELAQTGGMTADLAALAGTLLAVGALLVTGANRRSSASSTR